MFPVVTVLPDAPRHSETLGSKPKFWYDDPDLGLCLFKEVRPGTGEDWAEKVAEHVCRRVGLPHARYELAEWNGKRGVVTPVIKRTEERLILGNELLGEFVLEYEDATVCRRSCHCPEVPGKVGEQVWGHGLGSAPARRGTPLDCRQTLSETVLVGSRPRTPPKCPVDAARPRNPFGPRSAGTTPDFPPGEYAP